MNSTLADLRMSIDNIDSALIVLLAERFRLTQKVGELKRDTHMPSIDQRREAEHL
jgi:chorismate mutase